MYSLTDTQIAILLDQLQYALDPAYLIRISEKGNSSSYLEYVSSHMQVLANCVATNELDNWSYLVWGIYTDAPYFD